VASDILLSAKMYIFSLELKEELFWYIKIKKKTILKMILVKSKTIQIL
jgi:hypothetical protein